MHTPKTNQQSHAMTFLNTSLVSKPPLFLVAAMLSVSAMAADFDQVQRLANQGDAEAQYNLGVRYENGEGVRQNMITAKEWYGKSCDNGVQRGCDNYRKLN